MSDSILTKIADAAGVATSGSPIRIAAYLLRTASEGRDKALQLRMGKLKRSAVEAEAEYGDPRQRRIARAALKRGVG